MGYYVVRSARSRGPSDLIALKRGEVLLVQCRCRGDLTGEERRRLKRLAEELGVRAILAQKRGRRITLEEL